MKPTAAWLHTSIVWQELREIAGKFRPRVFFKSGLVLTIIRAAVKDNRAEATGLAYCFRFGFTGSEAALAGRW